MRKILIAFAVSLGLLCGLTGVPAQAATARNVSSAVNASTSTASVVSGHVALQTVPVQGDPAGFPKINPCKFAKKVCDQVWKYIKDHYGSSLGKWAQAGLKAFKNGMNGIKNRLPGPIKALVSWFWSDFVEWAYKQFPCSVRPDC